MGSGIGGTDAQDLETIEKIRWSLRQRLCEQLRRLNTELFDELDDFLFFSVQAEELADGSPQLKLIREYRNKKQLFEERFLTSIDGALQSTLVPQSDDQNVTAQLNDEKTTSSTYEKMEVDLALERMQRKAFKFYSVRIRELGGSGREAVGTDADKVIPENRDILIKNSLRALASAHLVFRVSLESRLVFLKLFEKHFLLKMDRLYQDVLSIINNKDNQKFVERLYASSTTIHKRRRSRSQIIGPTGADRSSPEVEPLMVSQRVSEKVAELTEKWCAHATTPEFIKEMLRQDWQNVMFLVGLNKGVETREWNEARDTVEILLDRLSVGAADSGDETGVKQICTRLQQGFELAQTDPLEQETFFQALRELLSSASNAVRENVKPDEDRKAGRRSVVSSSNYAAVSEAGRKVLDNGDLDDFIALLSDEQEQAIAEVEEQAISMDYYLNMVDAIADGSVAEVNHGGQAHRCTVQKSSNVVDSYQVLDERGCVLLTRGRVGLAVSLRAGEIRLQGQEDFQPVHSSSQLSHTATGSEFDRRTSH